MAGDGLLPILKEAQAQVPYLAIHQSFNDTLVMEEMPDYIGGFAGEIPEISGGTVAQGVLEVALRQGRTSGIMALGNPVPGHEFVGKRVKAMKDAATAFNDKNGTSFEVEEFDDKVAGRRGCGADLQDLHSQARGRPCGLLRARQLSDRRHHPGDEGDRHRSGEYPIATIDTAPVSNEGVREGYVLFIYDNQYYTASFIPAVQRGSTWSAASRRCSAIRPGRW